MITLSLCMIVKNEAQVLERCLKSITPAADEIIIVDTGSDDDTKDIAAKFTDKIYDFPWNDDFAAARNFSFSKATMDYCMWMDADDVITPENLSRLIHLKETLAPSTIMVMLLYAAAFRSDHTPSFVYYRERLVKNHCGLQWCGRIHECITPVGNIIYEDIIIEHRKPAGTNNTGRNLRIYESIIAQGQPLSSRDTLYYGRELFFAGRYEEARERFINVIYDDSAWSENQIDACRYLAKCGEILKRPDESLEALFKSFAFDLPRAEILYEIGMVFQRRKDYQRAVYWYRLAMDCRENPRSGGFVEKDYYGYYPSIQLCVCYYHLGDLSTAYKYHKKSGKWHTDTPEYLHNEEFFKKIIGDDAPLITVRHEAVDCSPADI